MFNRSRPDKRWLAVLPRLLAGIGLLLILGSTPVSPVAAAETSAITIHLRVCPQEFQGPGFFATCHNSPVADMSFQLDGPMPATATTDVAGNLTFAELAAGTYTVRGGPPGDFVRNTIVCSRVNDLSQPVAINHFDNTAFTVALAAGDPIICDWYSVPEYAGGPTPVPVQ